MTKITKAKCGECKAALIDAFRIVTLNCPKCSRENSLYTVEINERSRCRYCNNTLIHNQDHESSVETPNEKNQKPIQNGGCKTCGKDLTKSQKIIDITYNMKVSLLIFAMIVLLNLHPTNG